MFAAPADCGERHFRLDELAKRSSHTRECSGCRGARSLRGWSPPALDATCRERGRTRSRSGGRRVKLCSRWRTKSEQEFRGIDHNDVEAKTCSRVRGSAEWDRTAVRAKQLIDGASFGPEALQAIRKAFDEAWAEIAGNFGDDAADIEAARLKLAKAMLSLADEESRDVAV